MNFLYVRRCVWVYLFSYDKRILSVFRCVCVCASILYVLALFTSYSRYHGFPLHVVGLCRVSWTKLIFSIHSISVHQYWGSHCRCGKLYLYFIDVLNYHELLFEDVTCSYIKNSIDYSFLNLTFLWLMGAKSTATTGQYPRISLKWLLQKPTQMSNT